MSQPNNSLGREARQISLPQIGIVGQEKLNNSVVVVIGMGGIGCIAASYLTSSGVGKIFICDFDSIDRTNLGRQILYNEKDIGRKKVFCGREKLIALNSKVNITAINERINQTVLSKIRGIENALFLDCTDNFSSRFEINRFAVDNNSYLITGSSIRFEGQICVFGNDYNQSSCYECLYSVDDESLDDCAGGGVLNPIPGMIGSLMAIEAIKIITGNKINNSLKIYDGLSSEWKSVNISKNPKCEACGKININF